MEVGGEARIRITEDIGIVPFIEGGIIGDQPFVDFEEQFLWAAGLGLRYYTAVGPLRLDVAFPINGREQDDFFQFYVSLGQAF
jgi:translocation and assembly module TamA